MTFLRSVIMAFSTFSIIPMPRLDWKKENMRYMLSALPLVGVVIGLAMSLWAWICLRLSVGPALYAAGMTLIPLILSGGIHMDGFCDTVDALSSHADPERKREILKDSHTGAFAVLAAAAYLLLAWACWMELPRTMAAAVAGGLFFVLSRSVGALASVLLPSSSQEGLLSTFAGAAVRLSAIILLVWITACAVVLMVLSPMCGAFSLLLAAACLMYMTRMSRREFGGMSGDLAGFLIAGSELVLLLGQAICSRAASL